MIFITVLVYVLSNNVVLFFGKYYTKGLHISWLAKQNATLRWGETVMLTKRYPGGNADDPDF